VRDDRLSESRNALLRRIEEREPEPDELGWGDLRREAANAGTKRGLEASLAFHRRLTFCLAPLVFAFLGSVLGLRIGRRGRSYGVLLSLLAMFVYYLLALAGEQLARGQVISPPLGAWAAPALTLLAGILLAAFGTRIRPIRIRHEQKRPITNVVAGGDVRRERRKLVALLGLLDRDLLRSLVSNFLLSFTGLTLIFLVFTLFELLRYVVQSRTGYYLVAQYMLFLLPYVWVILIPIGTLLAVMITFALLVRRGEALVWWASGQSTFRLVLPCVLFAAVLACAHWFLQENVMPSANRRQNALRTQIKGGGSQSETSRGRFWVTNPEARQIYTFESKEAGKEVSNIIVYEFDEGEVHLRRVLLGEGGEVDGEKLKVRNPLVLALGAGVGPGRVEQQFEAGAEGLRALKTELNRPSEYDTKSLSAYINELKRRGVGTESHVVALERRRADPFAPFVMVLVSAPLALFYGRRSTVAALCVAVALGLSFWGVVSALQQMGSGGLLSPKLAAWSPSFIYTVLGLYLLARAKT
jgi:LPS export ABC transporter permease LptG